MDDARNWKDHVLDDDVCEEYDCANGHPSRVWSTQYSIGPGVVGGMGRVFSKRK